jgi:hypothetical protein
MSIKNTVAIGAGVIVLAVGANQALVPKDVNDYQENRRQTQLEELSDSYERDTGRVRDEGNAHLDAELDQRNMPVEPRPGERPHLKIRLR